MTTFILVLDIFLIFLLGGVAGLLVWLHFKLKDFRAAQKKMPELSDNLVENIVRARSIMTQMMSSLNQKSPEVDEMSRKMQDSIQDAKYMLDRAESLLTQLDDKITDARVVIANAQSKPEISASESVESISARVDEAPTKPKVQVNSEQQQQKDQKVVRVHPQVIAHHRLAEAYKKQRDKTSQDEERLRRVLKESE